MEEKYSSICKIETPLCTKHSKMILKAQPHKRMHISPINQVGIQNTYGFHGGFNYRDYCISGMGRRDSEKSLTLL